MTELNFSRAVNLDIIHASGRKLTGALTFARDDSVAVNWAGKTIYWTVYDNKWTTRGSTTATVYWNTVSDPTKITVSTDTVTFAAVVENSSGTDLAPGTYYHELYDSNNDLIAYGNLELL